MDRWRRGSPFRWLICCLDRFGFRPVRPELVEGRIDFIFVSKSSVNKWSKNHRMQRRSKSPHIDGGHEKNLSLIKVTFFIRGKRRRQGMVWVIMLIGKIFYFLWNSISSFFKKNRNAARFQGTWPVLGTRRWADKTKDKASTSIITKYSLFHFSVMNKPAKIH